MTPAIPAAVTATVKLANGFGLSTTSRPPIPEPAMPPGSGTLRSAERRLRVQLSMVLRRKLYTKVALVPFHSPHALSLCHSCPITSNRESDFRSSSLYDVLFEPGVGVDESDLLGALLA
jgi:hypothetical protein